MKRNIATVRRVTGTCNAGYRVGDKIVVNRDIACIDKERSDSLRIFALNAILVNMCRVEPGEKVELWWKRGMEYQKLPAEVSEGGTILVGGADVLAVAGLPMGQAVDMALASGEKRAQAKVIPFPIEARRGALWISAELMTESGLVFLITAGGFEPVEKVEVTSEFKSESHQDVVEASETDTMFVMRSLRNTERVLRNEIAEKVVAMEAQGAGIAELAPLVTGRNGLRVLKDGETDVGLMAAGQSVGLVHDVPTVQELIDTIISEAHEIVDGRLTAMIS